MKKFFAILLTVCLVASLFVMPVSAASIFNTYEYLDLDGSNIIDFSVNTGNAYVVSGSTPTQFTDYPVSNLLDGDETTTAILNYSGHATRYLGNAATNCDTTADVFLASNIVIDLGADYTISAVTPVYPTQAQQTAINTTYSTYVNKKDAPTAANNYGSISFYKENPATSSETPFTCKGGNTFNNPFNYDSANKYRYIKITGTWCNLGPIILNELKVQVATEAAADQYGYRYAAFGQTTTNVVEPTYPLSNMFDGDPNTSALLAMRSDTASASCAYSIQVVDLGAARKLSKLGITVPSNYKDLLEAVDITTHNGNYCHIYGYENEPTFTQGLAPSGNPPLTQDPSGIELHNGALSTKDVEITTDTPIRYLAFYTYMASYPGMISELEVAYDDREGSVSFETTAAAGEVPAASYTQYTSNTSATFCDEYPVSNLFDGDSSTTGFVVALSSTKKAVPSYLVIDLGKEYYLANFTYTLPENTAELLSAIGMQTVGSDASSGPDGSINQVNIGEIYASATAPTITNGAVSNYGTSIKDITKGSAWGNCGSALDGSIPYRYITISTSSNYGLMLSDLTITDINGVDVMQAQKEVVRFYVAPTLTSKFYDTESFGMYIIPFAIFVDEGHSATELNSNMVEMNTKIVTGQNYSADLTGIPAEHADTPIAVIPFVKLGGDYFYGDESQFTLNGLK